jgi:hypothetical protein
LTVGVAAVEDEEEVEDVDDVFNELVDGRVAGFTCMAISL